MLGGTGGREVDRGFYECDSLRYRGLPRGYITAAIVALQILVGISALEVKLDLEIDMFTVQHGAKCAEIYTYSHYNIWRKETLISPETSTTIYMEEKQELGC